MSGRLTTFVGLFDGGIRRIVIPRIQRDYAQGRVDVDATRIRAAFLDVVHRALTSSEPAGLDFIYGDVAEDGTLTPLDGQQRLTTLFLLHWYLAARAGKLDPKPAWTGFAYDTRPGARLFCERLVERARPFPLGGQVRLSAWMADQHWFMSRWTHDPTIGAMLVMLDAIHDRFGEVDASAAWSRLTDAEEKPIAFHVLEIAKMGLTEDLYVKMNSRGKPLTEFEHFKALFEQRIEDAHGPRSHELAERLDGDWANVFWPYRNLDSASGAGDVVDEELLRYFDFVTETLAWSGGLLPPGARMARVDALFGKENPNASANLDHLFAAFDTWTGVDGVPAYFQALLAFEGHVPGKVTIFGRQGEVDLFAACCASYSAEARGKRPFTLQRTLLLYAVLVHRVEGTAELPGRLRALRNLLEASQFQVRAEAMPQLVQATRRLMKDGVTADLAGFNPSQIEEERRKEGLLLEHPGLRPLIEELEDHPLLRGTLGVFDWDPERFTRRAVAFHALFLDAHFPSLTAALLTFGDYSQWAPDQRFYYFGSRNGEAWRDLFVGTEQSGRKRTRDALMALLDRVADTQGDVTATLGTIRAEWLAAREAEAVYDWRTYLVKYGVMREGASGIYAVAARKLGYDVCMLDRRQMNSNYRDPYLYAMRRVAGVGAEVDDKKFTGFEHFERWMQLPRSGAAVRCVAKGIAVHRPTVEGKDAAFDGACASLGVVDNLLAVPQEGDIDARDRVVLGAALLNALVAAGC